MDINEIKLIDEALEYPIIKDFISDNKIDKEFLNNHLNTILSFYLKRSECDKCNGKCPLSRINLKPSLTLEDGILDIDYNPCEYLENDYLRNLDLYSYTLISGGNLYINDQRKNVLGRVKKYLSNVDLDNFTKGIYLYGKYGVGKSYIMQDLALSLAKKDYKVAIVYYPDFVRRIKAMIFNGGVEEIVESLKNVDFLFLDDLGGESNTTFIRDEVLLPILQYRMSYKKPLFATSNLSFSELVEHLSASNKDVDMIKASRITERIRSLCDEVELNDKNYR